MRIAVGSENPVKITGVENAVKRIWADAEILAVGCPSGVSEQPMSDDEAIEGAVNRALSSLRKTGADLGIGLEGCTIDTKYGMFVSGWAVAIDRKGEMGIACGGRLLLPEKVAAEVRKGRELGPVMDEFVGEDNIKRKQGAVGVLTNNLVPRTAAFERTLIYALARFICPDYYK